MHAKQETSGCTHCPNDDECANRLEALGTRRVARGAFGHDAHAAFVELLRHAALHAAWGESWQEASSD